MYIATPNIMYLRAILSLYLLIYLYKYENKFNRLRAENINTVDFKRKDIFIRLNNNMLRKKITKLTL